MKIAIPVLLALLLIIGFSVDNINAQVTTNSGSGLAATYPSLASAITALNAATITSPVVITLTGNETAPPNGYKITQLGGTSTNTITIQGSSSTITAGLQVAGRQHDAIFKIIGGDYITFKNFTLRENPSNTVTTPIESQTMTEFAVAFFPFSATDGAQNNTVRDNNITLTTSYQNTFGILSTCSNNDTLGTLEASATTGTNSNNIFYGNTISNVAYGMYFICPPVTATVFENGIDIGGTAPETGNSITFGSTTQANIGLNRFSQILPAGITFRNGGAGANVRYNNITSYNVSFTQGQGVGGIVTTIGTAATGVTYTSNRSNNTIT